MKFDPRYFIIQAQKEGVELTRYDRDHIHLDSHGKPVATLWKAATKRHKRQLLKHLPDYQTSRLQANLFTACGLNPADYYPPKRRPTPLATLMANLLG